MSLTLPMQNNRIAVAAITQRGIGLAGRVIAALPGARLPQKDQSGIDRFNVCSALREGQD